MNFLIQITSTYSILFSLILNNITLITIVILVFLIETRKRTPTKNAAAVVPSGE